MGESGFLLSRLPLEPHYERLITTGEFVQRLLNFSEAGKFVQPARAFAKFADRLRPTQEQHRHDRYCWRIHLVNVVYHVLVLHRPACTAVIKINEVFIAKAVDSCKNSSVVIIDYRVAICLLISGGGQRIQRKRIIFRCCQLFFDEAAEDTNFYVS